MWMDCSGRLAAAGTISVPRAVVATWDRHVTALIDGREQRKMVPIGSAGGDFL